MEHFKYNQKIRAYDYKPSEGFEKFIEGAVIYSGMIKHPKYNIDMYEGYIIQVTNADDENDPTDYALHLALKIPQIVIE